jgi:class 3 adenylate cyclase
MPGGAFASASSTGTGKLSWAAASGRTKPPPPDVVAAASGTAKGSTNSSGLFYGLRVRMGIASGTVPWEAGSSRGDGSSAAASLAAIMDSSLYKLAVGES